MSGERMVPMSQEQRYWLEEAYARGESDSWNVPAELVAAFDAASPAAADAPTSLREVVEAQVRVSNPEHWRLDDDETTDAAIGHATRRIAQREEQAAAERGEPDG